MAKHRLTVRDGAYVLRLSTSGMPAACSNAGSTVIYDSFATRIQDNFVRAEIARRFSGLAAKDALRRLNECYTRLAKLKRGKKYKGRRRYTQSAESNAPKPWTDEQIFAWDAAEHARRLQGDSLLHGDANNYDTMTFDPVAKKRR